MVLGLLPDVCPNDVTVADRLLIVSETEEGEIIIIMTLSLANALSLTVLQNSGMELSPF